MAFAAISILVIQGGLSLGAGVFDEALAEGSEALAALTSAGGVLIIGISLKLLGLKDVRVGNFLPALVIAPVLVGSCRWCRRSCGGCAACLRRRSALVTAPGEGEDPAGRAGGST